MILSTTTTMNHWPIMKPCMTSMILIQLSFMSLFTTITMSMMCMTLSITSQCTMEIQYTISHLIMSQFTMSQFIMIPMVTKLTVIGKNQFIIQIHSATPQITMSMVTITPWTTTCENFSRILLIQ